MLSQELLGRIDRTIDDYETRLLELSRSIFDRPELCFEERHASAAIASLLRAEGHECAVEFGGLPTALCARDGAGAPHVAILAEYDALAGLGHACGHNLIATGAVGAFLAASRVRPEGTTGTLSLFGTPAEEGGGGKIRMIEAGVFADVDAAIMFHPLDRNVLMHPTLASRWLRFRFEGTPAHAAFAPYEGRSALQACLDTLRLIDGQRIRFRDGVRVHGIVREGGKASNIVVERASCEVNVRAKTTDELSRVCGIIERCAQAGALASEVSLASDHTPGYREMINNRPLAWAMRDHLRAFGVDVPETDPDLGLASTDMGDVSHVVPAIHPWLAIADTGTTMCHTHTFAAAARSSRGERTALVAAKALAATALEVLMDPSLLADVSRDFASHRR